MVEPEPVTSEWIKWATLRGAGRKAVPHWTRFVNGVETAAELKDKNGDGHRPDGIGRASPRFWQYTPLGSNQQPSVP